MLSGELVKIAADHFRKCCIFRWLFLFPAKCIWNKTNVRGQKNNSALFWGRRSDCWLGVCGFVPLQKGYSFAILAHGTEISSNNSRCCAEILPGLCALIMWWLQGNKHLSSNPFAAKAAVADFKYLPNQPSNLIACNNPVWMFFQPNFYPLCVVYLQRLNKETTGVWSSWVLCGGRQTMCTPLFPSIVYHLDIPRMRIVTIQCQDNWIFFRWLHITDKIYEPLRRALFLDPSSLVTSGYWIWWRAIQEFSIHVAPKKHQKGRNICNGGIHAVNKCH